MEADPRKRWIHDEARLNDLLAEVLLGDTMHLELVEVDARIDKHVDGLLIFGLLIIIEIKVELPR